MADVGVAPQQTPVTDKNIGTVKAHGLTTPDSTPPPEDGRIKAEEARQKASAKSLLNSKDESKGDGAKSDAATTSNNGDATTTNNKPPIDGDAATTSNKPPIDGDPMETETTTPRPERTKWHLDVYKEYEEILGGLVNQPEDADLVGGLDDINNEIREYNMEHGFSQDQFVIDYSRYIAAFKEAAPYLARLKTQSDEEARRGIESINKELEKYNKEHDYPSGWAIIIPAPQRKVTSRRGWASEQTAGRGRKSKTRTAWRPKALTFNERDGYVLHRGVEKEIAGYVPAGFGHRLLLRQDGRNDYDIYELVRASKFGKNYINRNKNVLEGKEMKVGTKKKLEGENFKHVQVYGVAPVITDSDDEAMLMAWLQFPNSQPRWYWRGSLGDKFGLDKVDEVLNMYRKEAGQRPRRSARSISLGEEDTTDDDGEVEDAEDSEDDGDLDDEAKLHVLMKEVENLQKSLKKSRNKPGNKSSTSSRKSKSKRAK
jgi:hypothetical protein